MMANWVVVSVPIAAGNVMPKTPKPSDTEI
jgi:hypothetical protein